MNVLMSAYSCRPESGSESGVGWRFAAEVAKRHEVWVITDGSNRPSIEEWYNGQVPRNPRFVYHSVAFCPGWLKRNQFGVQLHYYLWQRTLTGAAAQLHRQVGFDVCHHTVWARYWMPSGLADLGVPFVWGPIGAAESLPTGFSHGLGLRARALENLRDLARLAAHLDPALNRTASSAAVTLVTTEATGERVLALGSQRIQQMPTVGFSAAELQYFQNLPDPDTSVFRAICIGRLLHWKGFHLAIKAFAQFHRKCPRSELWIVNDGPERARLEKLAQRSGVGQTVRFWGRLASLGDVHSKLSQCQVLIHPALHESFGNVCTEAMASGRPVICLDTGGPATQVTADSGFKVRPSSEEDAVQGIADALEHLCEDPLLCARLGRGAQQRVAREFSNDALMARLTRLYQEAAVAGGSRRVANNAQ